MIKRVSGELEIDPRVVAVCRAMALSDGYPDPDSDSCIRQSPQTGIMGTQGCAERGPLWKRYWIEGKYFVAAFDALNAMADASDQGEG